MNPQLTNYCQRFSKPNQIRPVFKDFFTNLDVQTHWENLPYLHDIQNFCLRLTIAYLNKEKICIYSDYDTDAVTATGVMYKGLLDLGFDKKNIEFYAPDRFTEGYGINTDAIAMLCTKFDLIISVDCGINSVVEADIVNQYNKNQELKNLKKRCDLIITDHHHLHTEIPDCLAVVNCRMGQVYCDKKTNPKINTDLVQKLTNILTKNTKENEQNDTQKTHVFELNNWLEKSFEQYKSFEQSPEKFLSQSVTGVGVSWFCLVWYTYFIEYVSIN